MAYVDLSAFDKAVNNSQSIVSNMQAQMESLGNALSFLKVGIQSADAAKLHDACTKHAAAVENTLQAIQTLLRNISTEKQETETRLNTLD